MLTASNVSKTYGKVHALSGVSFVVDENQVVGLLGHNGAGKTTLLKCILGFLNFEGEIRVNDVDVKNDSVNARRYIGYVPQHPALYDKLTVLEHVKLYARMKNVNDAEIIREKLELVGLFDKRDRAVRALSHGMRQRLALGMALLNDPPLLLLDEPFSNIDVLGQIKLVRLLEELRRVGKTLLITSHQVGIGQLLDKAVILHNGRVLLEGPTQELLTRLKLRDRMYIKLDGEDGLIKSAIDELDSGLVESVSFNEGWLAVTCRAEAKAEVINFLIKSGLRVSDILSEGASLEKMYTELVEAGERWG